MTFFHSTPTKKPSIYRMHYTKQFYRDYVECFEDKLDLDASTLSDDHTEDWVVIEMGSVPRGSQLFEQNDAKLTPGQRLVMSVHELVNVLGIYKVIRRMRLRKELAEMEDRLNRKCMENTSFDWSSSKSPFGSLDDSDTL